MKKPKKMKMKGGELMQTMPSSPSPNQDDYETEGHLRTLMDAEKIKGDPEKMKKVHKLAGRHHKAIRSIQDLKDLRNEAFKPAGKGDMDDSGGTEEVE